ncbi:MAG: SEC-C domain-containing protein [Deltaproteobacteria bacterium]|nr:SEC-C domain-containing protein [Deltaproteobacteria bacterium]
MKKPGRNELCPCGSGKKYKKCCLDTGQSRHGGNLYIY